MRAIQRHLDFLFQRFGGLSTAAQRLALAPYKPFQGQPRPTMLKQIMGLGPETE
jgi:hypothetical protein